MCWIDSAEASATNLLWERTQRSSSIHEDNLRHKVTQIVTKCNNHERMRHKIGRCLLFAQNKGWRGPWHRRFEMSVVGCTAQLTSMAGDQSHRNRGLMTGELMLGGLPGDSHHTMRGARGEVVQGDVSVTSRGGEGGVGIGDSRKLCPRRDTSKCSNETIHSNYFY